MIFQWTSDEPADFIVILAQLAGDYGGTPLELVSCVVRDDGSFAIPADIWTQWADGDVVIVEFGRLDVSDRTLPHNRANAEFAAISWQIGALLTN